MVAGPLHPRATATHAALRPADPPGPMRLRLSDLPPRPQARPLLRRHPAADRRHRRGQSGQLRRARERPRAESDPRPASCSVMAAGAPTPRSPTCTSRRRNGARQRALRADDYADLRSSRRASKRCAPAPTTRLDDRDRRRAKRFEDRGRQLYALVRRSDASAPPDSSRARSTRPPTPSSTPSAPTSTAPTATARGRRALRHARADAKREHADHRRARAAGRLAPASRARPPPHAPPARSRTPPRRSPRATSTRTCPSGPRDEVGRTAAALPR